MPSNAKAYATWLRRQGKQIPERVYMPRFRRFAFKVLEVALQNTPVNTGRLRNGWHVTIGTPTGHDVTGVAAGPVEEGSRGGAPSVAAVLQTGKRIIDSTEFGQSIWIQNNVPYARVIEDGLYVPENPGPSKALHVPKSRRKRVAGTVLVQGGYHVSAPRGMLADAAQTAREAWQSGAL